MDYDFRNRQNPPPYNSSNQNQNPYGLYTPTTSHPMYSHSSNYPQPRLGSSSHPSPGMGIKVGIKPDFRITPPPQLSPIIGDIPHSTFEFNFDYESKVIAELEKDSPNWSRFTIENPPSRTAGPSSLGPATDPLVNKYLALGLSREAVPFALANYGDNPIKVKEFVNGFTRLQEMGFSSNNVAEALSMYDNDADKALAYFLNNSS